MAVDISDLVNDNRLPPNTSMKINGNQLEILFSNGRYKLLPEKSELKDNGRTWAVYLHSSQVGVTAFCTRRYDIPEGVEKIVLASPDSQSPVSPRYGGGRVC